MAKMIKNLTVANIRKIEGMERREDLDFSDDGNYFRGFSYKGMPITTLRCNKDNTTYLSIRVDYISTKFTYKDWMETEEWALTEEFNGVSEIDLDKLIENLEKVIAKVAEMNEKASNEVIDTREVEAKLAKEIENAESIVEEFKKNFKWYEVSPYEVNKMSDYVRSATKMIAKVKAIDFGSMENKEKSFLVQRFNEYGYVEFRDDFFYFTEMKKYLNK